MLVNDNTIRKDIEMYEKKLHIYKNQYEILLDKQRECWVLLEDEDISQKVWDYYSNLYDQNLDIMDKLEVKIEILEEAIEQLKNIVEILDIVEVEIEGV